MDLQEFKKQYIKQELGITEEYARIFSFIDFGNVNNWFEEDRQDADNNKLQSDEKLEINLEALNNFLYLFSGDVRFYYGHDRQNSGSLGFIRVARDIFGKHRVFTKQIQKVRHHLTDEEVEINTREIYKDTDGPYVFIPKCNFDVEIAVDAVKLIEGYDTFCLLSSDADFVHLARFLKSKGKKVVLIKGGHIVHQWKTVADSIINVQKVKRYITRIKKQKPGS